MISIEEDGLLHKLEITNPVMADMGKYTCDINGVSTSARLEVEGEPLTLAMMFKYCKIILLSTFYLPDKKETKS